MGEYIGLDVSMKDTSISVRREGKRIWRGKCASDPEAIARMIRKHSQAPERVIFETGPLSVWFYHALQVEGLPAICVDARHAKAALDLAANKTDAILIALFVIARGIALLQVAANPYVAVIGPPETSESRLTLVQAFNSMGTFFAPYFGGYLILNRTVSGRTMEGIAFSASSPSRSATYALHHAWTCRPALR